MPCKDNCNCANQEIAVCNTVFKYNLIPVDTNTHVVCVSRCSTPTATFEIATIRTRTNTCSDGTYYQATINGDPVEIIQDCSLCDIIRRAIEIYFSNFEPINCTRGRGNGCGCHNLFGF